MKKKLFFVFAILILGWHINSYAQSYDIVWTDIVGGTVSGNTLTKTTSQAWGNSGAASVNVLPAGQDGWVEMTIQETTAYRDFGFSSSNTNAHYNTIEFGLYLYDGGFIGINENGTNKGTFGNYISGDVLRVERVGTIIYYKQNGTTIYTSLTSSNSQLIADAAIYTQNATIANAKASFNIPGGSTDWQLNGNDIFYDAGVVSVNTTATTKAFSIVNNGTTEFQINGDGKAYAREVEVTLNPFPDYVFEKDYSLMPLSELDKFITEEKHLPNIPSAREVEEKGLGLGSLSIKQMEKIEELTLYILELHKRLEKLEKENLEIKKRLNK